MVLKSQENSRLFGEETYGATSTLKKFSFSNGAILYIAEKYWCDKNKNLIKGGIKPDVTCPPEKSLEQAIKWIES